MMMMLMVMMVIVLLAQDPATDKMVERARLPIAARMAGGGAGPLQTADALFPPLTLHTFAEQELVFRLFRVDGSAQTPGAPSARRLIAACTCSAAQLLAGAEAGEGAVPVSRTVLALSRGDDNELERELRQTRAALVLSTQVVHGNLLWPGPVTPSPSPLPSLSPPSPSPLLSPSGGQQWTHGASLNSGCA
jgi:hypothetical protein